MKKSDSKKKKDIWFAVFLVIISLVCVFVAEEKFGDASKSVPLVVLLIACLLFIRAYIDVNLIFMVYAPWMAILLIAGLAACLGYTIRQDWSGIAGGFITGIFLGAFIVPEEREQKNS